MREYVISHKARSEDKLLGLVVTRQLQAGKVRSNEGNVQLSFAFGGQSISKIWPCA